MSSQSTIITKNSQDLEKQHSESTNSDQIPLLITKGKDYDAFAHENSSNFPEGGIKAWLTVFGSMFGLMTVFGVMQTISSIQLYIQSNQLKDVKTSSTAWTFSLYMFGNLSMGIVSGPLFDRYGIKNVIIPGIILNCGGLYACAFSTELWHFILSFGIASGIGSGMMLNPLLSVISHWFLKRRGLALGVAQLGSLSGIVFPMMLKDLYPKLGFEKTMVVLASICVALCLLSYFLVFDRHSEINGSDKKDKDAWRIIIDMLDIKFFKDKTFTITTAALFFNEFSILLVITYLSSYALVRGLPESSSYVLITVLNSAALFGKLIPNITSDYLGRFNVMIMVSSLMLFSIFAIWLPYYNTIGLYAFAVLYGFAFGGSYSLTATVVSQISHTREFASRFATSYFIVAFGNLISMPVGSQLINEQSVKNYNNMIIFAGVACAISLFFFIWARITIIGPYFWKFV